MIRPLGASGTGYGAAETPHQLFRGDPVFALGRRHRGGLRTDPAPKALRVLGTELLREVAIQPARQFSGRCREARCRREVIILASSQKRDLLLLPMPRLRGENPSVLRIVLFRRRVQSRRQGRGLPRARARRVRNERRGRYARLAGNIFRSVQEFDEGVLHKRAHVPEVSPGHFACKPTWLDTSTARTWSKR